MYIISIIVISIASFVSGMYFEKSNSIRKVKPLKRAFTNINADRTITVSRTAK